MKIKLLAIVMLTAIAATGCLKDSKQPVTHINDVNIALTGTWTATSGTIKYYDANNNQVYSENAPAYTFRFDGNSTLYISTPEIAMTEDYSITTADNADYVNTTGVAIGNHRYAISLLQARNLKLTEKVNYPEGSTLTVGSNIINFFSTVQVTNYQKKDAPQN